jgi:cytochrome P450
MFCILYNVYKFILFVIIVFIENYSIPPMTTVVIFPYILHRNENIYSKPEDFIPERFLDEENKSKFLFGYIPFSAGARNCIGNLIFFISYNIQEII